MGFGAYKCRNKDCEHDAAYCYNHAKEEMKVTHLLKVTFDVPVKTKGEPWNIVSTLHIKKNDFIIVSGDDAEFVAHQLAVKSRTTDVARQLGFTVPIIIMNDGRLDLKSIKSVKGLLKRMEEGGY